MTKVFTKFSGGDVRGDGSSVAVRLQDGNGSEETISLTAESIEVLAHELLALQAKAYEVQLGEPSKAYEVGSNIIIKALTPSRYQITTSDDATSGALIIWSQTGASYAFDLTIDFARRLESSLGTWLNRLGRR